MKLTELIEDRCGRLSPYKLAFLAGAFSMLFSLTKLSLEKGELMEVPQTWVYFLAVLGGSQLTSTFLQNKNEINKTSPPTILENPQSLK